MKVLHLLLNRKIIVGLLILFILLLGTFASQKLEKELMPAVTFDMAMVEISAGDLPALDVESKITNLLEQKISSMKGVKSYQSTSAIGRSSLTVQFESGEGEEGFKQIEAEVAKLNAEIEEIKDVQAYQFATTAPHEMFMDLSKGSMEDMTNFANQVLKPRLEALPEVREVAYMGLEQKEIIITFNEEKLQKNSVDPMQFIAVLQQANENIAIGKLEGETDTTVRWKSEITSINELEELELSNALGELVKLKDVASVETETAVYSSTAWKDGESEFIFVQIGRPASVTTIEMTEAVRKEVAKIREEGLIEGFQLNEMMAQADYVKDSIEGVSNNVLYGGLLALVVLFLFLRNIRATIIIGLSIPISILLTFATMGMLGYSFNMISLIALGLGIGMMVDSSIVILESIYKKKELGFANREAVLQGTKEVATAVLASMLTTIVVFLPIGLLGGEAGKIMIILSVVVIITLVSSVIVAFTLIPTMSEKFLKTKERKSEEGGRIVRSYRRFITWMAGKKRRRIGIISLFALIFFSSFLLLMFVPKTVMPDMYNRQAEIYITLEKGTTPEAVNAIAEEINERMQKVTDVDSNIVYTFGNILGVFINMTPAEDATVEQKTINENIMQELREMVDAHPIEAVGGMEAFNGGSSPVQIEISGSDYETLKQLTKKLESKLSEVEGLTDISSTVDKTKTEQQIVVLHDKIKEDGLTKEQIKTQIQQAFTKMPVGSITLDYQNLPIYFMFSDDVISSKSELLKKEFITPIGIRKIGDYVKLEPYEAPVEIEHIDGNRIVKVGAQLDGKDLASVNLDVQNAIKEIDVPAGYFISLAGGLETQMERVKEMVMILAIAIFLVYVVMAIQFNSIKHPFVIMSVIPMTIVGVIIGLFITQQELSVMTGMGVVMLIGIVLNNAILLIDRTKQLRQEGKKVPEALLEAGINRTRPIFMTTLTTVFGMLPLALATGNASNYQAPMAIAIIAGLLFATMITLILIPGVYMLFEDVANGTKKIRLKKKQA
ncbi:acriflavin resistance protein [Lottiidibacillus patelloidae]|uniref:Acriflavin resistance protein n=1 Tax=Lottiidibacillus patelloidae TaxID=2670334 RepID=A0A263BTI5_9BACI|nr:efflux RND transporter permease subunit [Lottiidibacillus patelloidae]OZM56496.1 acriflavin resistance protein [Lottiidibacillus patelloidae]